MQSNVLNDLAKAKRRRTEKKNLRTSVSSGIESWVRHQHAFGRPVRTPGTRLPLKYEGKSLLTQLLQKAKHLIPEAVPWVPPDSTPLCARLIDRQNQSHIACRHFASRMFCPWVPWNAQGTNFHLNFNLQLSPCSTIACWHFILFPFIVHPKKILLSLVLYDPHPTPLHLSLEHPCTFQLLFKILQTKRAAQTLCEPAQSKCTSTFHRSHFVWTLTGKRPQWAPWSSTGFYTYRKK